MYRLSSGWMTLGFLLLGMTFLSPWASFAEEPIDVKIVTEGDVQVRVSGKVLLDVAGWKSASVDQLCLLHRGKAVPFRIEGVRTNRLEPSDFIVFDARSSETWTTRRSAYFLRFSPQKWTTDFEAIRSDIGMYRIEENRCWVAFEEPLPSLAARIDPAYLARIRGGSKQSFTQLLPMGLKTEGKAYVTIWAAANRVGTRLQVRFRKRVVGEVVIRRGVRTRAEISLGTALDGSGEILTFSVPNRGEVALDRIHITGEGLQRPPIAVVSPLEVRARKGRDLRSPGQGADYVALCPPEFLAALDPLVELRREQGLRVRVIDPESIYDEFGEGIYGPDAIRAFLEHAATAWPKPRPSFLLLAADATHDVDWLAEVPTIPTGVCHTFLNGATGSDHVYAMFGKDIIPQIAVGRFPARTVEELQVMVQKTVDYECSPDPGTWKRRITFLTGEGRFGRATDKVLETLAEKLIVFKIPDRYDVTLTHAGAHSVYLYPPREYGEKVLDRVNEGSLFLVYIGHGYAKGFDSLRWRGQKYPILDVRVLPRVEIRHGAPVTFVLACTTGAFDAPRIQSIGEGLLLRPAGPVAFFGSSRVSHPYANGILGKEILDAFFRGGDPDRMPRLGELMVRAKADILRGSRFDLMRLFIDGAASVLVQEGPPLERIRKEHLYLYNLLGDPALRLALPSIRPFIELDRERVRLGDSLEVRGRFPISQGQVLVTLEALVDAVVHPVQPVEPGVPGFEDVIRRNYESANNKVIARVESTLKSGAFSVRMSIPTQFPPGTYRVKVFVESDEGDGFTSRRIQLVSR